MMLNNICEQQINVITTVSIIIRHDVKFKFAISTVHSGQHQHNWHETFLLLMIWMKIMKKNRLYRYYYQFLHQD